RGRTGQRGEQIGRDRQRDQRSALDRQHPVAHYRKGGKRRDNRAEADETGDAQNRQNRRIGARVHGAAQRRQTTIAAASAVTTAHTPPTAASDVAPHALSTRKDASIRGKTNSDITRLTMTTTTSGRAASVIGGPAAL